MKKLGLFFKISRFFNTTKFNSNKVPLGVAKNASFDELKQILLQNFPELAEEPFLKRVKPDSHLIYDLGFDSLGALEYLMAVEKYYSVHISNKDAEQLLSLNDYITYLSEGHAEPQ